MSPYYSSNSYTAPNIVDATPSRTSSARVCYRSSPTPLPTYTYTRVVVVKKCSHINRPQQNIAAFDQVFARASSRNYSPARPIYREGAGAHANCESNHYSLSRWANENAREEPYRAPYAPHTSYAQHRYESESSRDQPWNAVREVHVVRAKEPRTTRPVRPSYSNTYYDPINGKLGGCTTRVLYRTAH